MNNQEMDLIEVLWKQDVDLGYNPIIPAHNVAQQKKETSSEDEIEKLKALLDLKTDKVCVCNLQYFYEYSHLSLSNFVTPMHKRLRWTPNVFVILLTSRIICRKNIK